MSELPPPERSPNGPAEGEPTVILTVDPDGVTEHIAVWWDGTSAADIMWVEIIFGARHWAMPGEHKVMRKSKPLSLGGIEFEAPVYEPDPASLEIRGQRVADLVPVGARGVWLCGRRPYQPMVRIRADQVLAGVDPRLERTIEAIIEGKAEVTMSIERKPIIGTDNDKGDEQ